MDSASACPYAVALQPDEHSENGDHESSPEFQKCPAFADSSCPFKDAKSASEVRQKMEQMPPSHFDKNGKFLKVVQEIHKKQTDLPDAALSPLFQLPGGCPVLQGQEGDKAKSSTFAEALEQMSLAAIMAREMKKQQGEEEDGGTSSEEEEEIKSDTLKDDSTKEQPKQPRVSLSESLKSGTAVSHQAAEDVHFVSNFIKGKIDRTLYGQLVLMLHQVYETLEKELDLHAPTYFPSCHFPRELARTAALADDVDFWHGSSAAIKLTQLSPATRDYVERLRFIGKTDPLLLLAHSYTRYLGDLSGGKILARVARRALQLGDNDGLDFYDFPNVASAKRFKDNYRKTLDQLPLTNEQIQKLVGEANVAFCLNMRLFEELDVAANVPGATVRPLQEALKYADLAKQQEGKNDTESSKDECPFLVQKESASNTANPQQQAQKRCPWPFVFAHDPVQGMRDWQTWAALGLILGWGWKLLQN